MTRNLCLARHERDRVCVHLLDRAHFHYRASRLVLCRALQEAERKIVPAYDQPRRNRPDDLPVPVRGDRK